MIFAGALNPPDLPRRFLPGVLDPGSFLFRISGSALMLEWKSEPIGLSKRQRIMYSRLTTSRALTVLCLAGDAETMVVTHRQIISGGDMNGWVPCDLEGAKEITKRWVKWATEIGEWRDAYQREQDEEERVDAAPTA